MADHLEQFRQAARQWLAAHATPMALKDAPVIGLIREVNSTAEVDEVRAWNRAKFDGGWAGITWPTRYGGQGLTAAEQLAWRQEVAAFDTPEDGCVVGPALAGPVLLGHGTDQQRDRHVRQILNGDHIWCQLFSEPEAGSDLASLRTTARAERDHWIVNGQKIWSSVAQFADFGLLLARTDPAAPRHHGITCFLLDMHAPGVTVRPIHQMNGQQTFNEVFFDGVVIPDEDRVADPGGGWRVAMHTVTSERIDLGLRRGVNVQRLLALASTLVDGIRPADDPGLRDRLVDVYVRAEALDALGRAGAERAIEGGASGPYGPIAKLIGAGLMNDAADLAVDCQGTRGLLTGQDAPEGGLWQAGFLSSPARRIGGGTDEIQRNVIAERFLGLPRG